MNIPSQYLSDLCIYIISIIGIQSKQKNLQETLQKRLEKKEEIISKFINQKQSFEESSKTQKQISNMFGNFRKRIIHLKIYGPITTTTYLLTRAI